MEGTPAVKERELEVKITAITAKKRGIRVEVKDGLIIRATWEKYENRHKIIRDAFEKNFLLY